MRASNYSKKMSRRCYEQDKFGIEMVTVPFLPNPTHNALAKRSQFHLGTKNIALANLCEG